jgi:hypothetical protein
MRGEERSTIARVVAEAYASGQLRAPRRAGINYMLSAENRVDDNGNIRPYRPHIMLYAPYLTNADFGGGQAGSPVFVINEGKPGAYLIVPVPSLSDEAHHSAADSR